MFPETSTTGRCRFHAFGAAALYVCATGAASAANVRENRPRTKTTLPATVPEEHQSSVPRAVTPPNAASGPPSPLVLIDDTWREPRERWFFASAIDVGFQYARPRGSAGYGIPHQSWIGADLNPILSPRALGAYLGLHAAIPAIDFRAGGRLFHGFNRSFLPIQDSYNRQEVDFHADDPAQYFSWEAELTINPRFAGGELDSETSVTWVTGVTEDRYLFEEQYRMIIDPPWLIRERLGYKFYLFSGNALRVGPVVETLWSPNREELVVRAGALIRFNVYSDLQIRVNLVPVIVSPDSLGLLGGDFGQFGVRWFWGTH